MVMGNITTERNAVGKHVSQFNSVFHVFRIM